MNLTTPYLPKLIKPLMLHYHASYHTAETAYHGTYKHTPKKHSIPSEQSWKKDKFIKKMSLDCNLSLVDIVSDL